MASSVPRAVAAQENAAARKGPATAKRARKGWSEVSRTMTL
jgi:hypothetical protein